MRSPSARLIQLALLGSFLFAMLPHAATRAQRPAGQEIMLHRFQDYIGGSFPTAPLLAGKDGELYGTTELCGDRRCEQPGFTGGRGIVFRIRPSGERFEVLFRFDSERGRAGSGSSGLMADGSGALYGTAVGEGGTTHTCPIGCGTVFRLQRHRPPDVSVLYHFQGGADGSGPIGGVISDSAGSLYGTTYEGGNALACKGPSGNTFGCGTVFKLKRVGSHYSESVLYRFQGSNDGASPVADVVADGAGALYGTTAYGGGGSAPGCTGYISGCGTVFKLTPTGSGYTESILYRFQGGNDGEQPQAGLIVDDSGALYGTTVFGGGCSTYGCGTVFKLTPIGSSYEESILHRFQGGTDGDGPTAGLLAGKSGALYGATGKGGANYGTVFRLTPTASGYSESVVYAFGGRSDGFAPVGTLIADATGALYGTTQEGGANPDCTTGCGTVFKVIP